MQIRFTVTLGTDTVRGFAAMGHHRPDAIKAELVAALAACLTDARNAIEPEDGEDDFDETAEELTNRLLDDEVDAVAGEDANGGDGEDR